MRWVYIALLCLLATSAGAQGGDFTARVSATRVAQHSVFDVTFTLSGGDGVQFEAPSFQDFDVVAGPSISQSTIIINGNLSYQMSWGFTLMARKQGRFSIGPASVQAGRKRISTDPITIEVGPPVSDPMAQTGGAESVLLVTETDGDTCYPGQQILLRHRLLYREPIHSVSTLAQDDYADFFVQRLPAERWPMRQVSVGGEVYNSQPIQVHALYAHQSGMYTLDPMVVSVGVQSGMPRMPGMPGFFSRLHTREITVTAPSHTLHVVPLPGDAPAAFTGAVGTYRMEMRASNRPLTTDDALTVHVEITGNGDPRRWDPPAPVIRGKAEVFPPRILKEQPVVVDTGLTHIRLIEYQVVPLEAGDLEVVIPFACFDPTSGTYTTLTSDTIRLSVRPGTGRATGHQQTGDAEPVWTPKPVRSGGLPDRFWASPIFLLFAGLILAGSLWGHWHVRARGRVVASPAARRAELVSNTLASLDALRDHPADTDTRDRATRIFLGFLQDRLGLTAADLHGPALQAALAHAEMPTDVQVEVLDIFERTQRIRYGGLTVPDEISRLLTDCRAVISRMG